MLEPLSLLLWSWLGKLACEHQGVLFLFPVSHYWDIAGLSSVHDHINLLLYCWKEEKWRKRRQRGREHMQDIREAPSVHSLTPLLVSLCSVWCLTASILICISKTMAEFPKRHPYQVTVSKHFLAPAVVIRFGYCIWDGSPDGSVSGWPFLQSLFQSLSLYFLPGEFGAPL